MRSTLVVGALGCVLGAGVISACGRVHYEGDGADASNDAARGLDASLPPIDALALDAPLDDAFGADAFAADAPSPPDGGTDAFGPDAAGPELVVTNTNATGPGSLGGAIEILNSACIAGFVISFAIPSSDPGFDGTVARIARPPDGNLVISCPGLTIDATTQTTTMGDTNTANLTGDLVAGAANAPFGSIPAPEIALIDTILTVDEAATGVTLRGFAVSTLVGQGNDLTVEDVTIGSEPDSPVAESTRSLEWSVYLDTLRARFTRVLVVGANGGPGVMSNLVAIGGGTVSFEQVAILTGSRSTDIFDLLHVVTGSTLTATRCVFSAGTQYEVAVEVAIGSNVTLVESSARGGTLHALRVVEGSAVLRASSIGIAGTHGLEVWPGQRATVEGTVFLDNGGTSIDLMQPTDTPSSTDCGYDGSGNAGIDRPVLTRPGAGPITVEGCPGAMVTLGVASALRGDGVPAAGELVRPATGGLYTTTLDASGRATLMGVVPAWLLSGPVTAYLTDTMGNTSPMALNL